MYRSVFMTMMCQCDMYEECPRKYSLSKFLVALALMSSVCQISCTCLNLFRNFNHE